MEKTKAWAYRWLRWSERYTKTDMVYLARGGFWMNVSFVFTNLLAFGLSIAFARLLPKDIYGTYQFILSIGAILNALTLTGMNNAVTQAVARGYEGTLRRSIGVQLVWNLVSFGAAIAIAVYYFMQGNSEIALGVMLIGFLSPVYSAYNTYAAFMTGKKEFRIGATYGMTLALAYSVCMAITLVFVKDPVSLVAVNIGVNTAVTVGLYALTVRRFEPNDRVDGAAIGYGKHLSLANVISTIAGQLDNLMVFHYLGTVDLAIYAFASTIPERASSALKSVSVLAFPKLSERTSGEIGQSMFPKTMRLFAFSLMIALIYIAVAPYVFWLFFPKYLSSVLYSQGYALAVALMAMPNLPLAGLTAMKAKREIYIYNIVNPIVSIGAMLALGIPFGVWGIIASKALSGGAAYGTAMILVRSAAKRPAIATDAGAPRESAATPMGRDAL